MKICTLIVTKDRPERLAKCLESVKEQSYADFDLCVLDGGTESSEEICAQFEFDRLSYVKVEPCKMNRAYITAFEEICKEDCGYDWIWTLHDDVIADKDALKGFVDTVNEEEEISVLSSMILSNDGKASNTPQVSTFSNNKGYGAWPAKLDKALVRVAALPLVSAFVKVEAVNVCGLPRITDNLGDNSNYVARLIGKYAPAYIAGRSKVVHDYKSVRVTHDKKTEKIAAVVVTFNRKVMLVDCIKALIAQSYSNYDILVIDNASTDGTYEYIKDLLSDRVKYFNTGANLGGSGGFYYGMKLAYEAGYDWFWIMDDDVVPTKSALAELVKAAHAVPNTSFFASAVYSKDGQAMNSPEISKFSTNGYRFWYGHLDKGMVRLAHATFVSLLINAKAVAKCGLPCRDYFIWGDDTEYTMRIIGKFAPAYIVGTSKVFHMRAISSNLSIRKETAPGRIKMYYNMVRNTLTNAKAYQSRKSVKRQIKNYYKDCIKILLKREPLAWLKVRTITRAINDFKRERYNVDAFNNRYKVYGQEKAVVNFLGCSDMAEKLRGVYPYTVNNVLPVFSVFSAFEPVSAYVEDMSFADVDCTTACELKKAHFETLSKKLIDKEMLFVDLSSSVEPVVKYATDKGTLIYKQSEEITQIVESGAIGGVKGESVTAIDLASMSEAEIASYIEKLVLAVSKVYDPSKVVLVERTDCEAANSAVLKTLNSEFKKRIPNCKTVKYSGDEKVDALVDSAI